MNDTEQRKAAKSIIFWRFVSRLNLANVCQEFFRKIGTFES